MSIESIEHAPRPRISIKRGLQIGRNLGLALRRIGSFESAIESGLLDLFHPRRTHPSHLDQRKRALTVHLRPFALRAPRCESNQPIVRVEPIPLSVDPSVAKGGVDCFLLRDARDIRRCLRELEPNALRRERLSCEPCFPFGSRSICANRKIGLALRRRHSYAFFAEPGR